jgi:Zierdtviridae exonuclease
LAGSGIRRSRTRAHRQARSLPRLSTSERLAFKACRWRWQREYVDRLVPITAAPSLRFGSLVHESLAAYYPPGIKRGPPPAETFQQLYVAELAEQEAFGFRDEDGKWEDAGQLGTAMLEHYIKEYGEDDQYKVIVTEQYFREPVLIEEVPRFVYVGVLDGVWQNRSTKRLLLAEHKTTSQIDTAHLFLDEQATAYWVFGVEYLRRKGLLAADKDIEGIRYNFLRKAKPDERPRNEAGEYLNKDGSVSAKQPPPYFLRHTVWRDEPDRLAARIRILQEWDEMEMVKAGTLAGYKSPTHDCKFCWARGACELHEIGDDWREFLSATTRDKDRYTEREIRETR